MNLSGKTKVDWHIHTYFSDGTMSPTEVVLRAKKYGLEEIAITDHDGVEGLDEAFREGKKSNIKVVAGIELSTINEDGTGFHILGFNIDPENEKLLKSCQHIKEKREERNEKLLAALAEEGYALEKKDLIMREGQDFIGKPIIAEAMVKRGYIKEKGEAFSGILNSPKMRAIKKEKISVGEAIALIKGAGGMPVLAHPGLVRHLGERESDEFFFNFEKLLSRLKSIGLEGLECDYSQHSTIERITFEKLAEKYNLSITAGSDFHGDNSHGSSKSKRFPIMGNTVDTSV